MSGTPMEDERWAGYEVPNSSGRSSARDTSSAKGAHWDRRTRDCLSSIGYAVDLLTVPDVLDRNQYVSYTCADVADVRAILLSARDVILNGTQHS